MIEIGYVRADVVLLRSTRTGRRLTLSPDEWDELSKAIKRGDHDQLTPPVDDPKPAVDPKPPVTTTGKPTVDSSQHTQQ